MERKYALIKAREGDYLFSSNDGQTLYRVRKYMEYGDGYLVDGNGKEHQIKGWHWESLKYTRGTPTDVANSTDSDEDILDDGERWDTVSFCVPTRKQAIVDCLEDALPKPPPPPRHEGRKHGPFPKPVIRAAKKRGDGLDPLRELLP